MILKVLIAIIIALNAYFAVILIRDLITHKDRIMQEKGHPVFYTVLGFVTMLLSTLGISDYAINTIVYRKTKYVDDRLIPPTLNTESTIPCFVMALCYITSVKCDVKTLIILIAAQTIGSILSPRIVVKLSEDAIRWFMGIGLGVAAVMILLGQLNVIPSNGTLTGLAGWKLIVAAVCMFAFGAFNNIGIGAFAPTMAVVYSLGVSPLVAFPIMMGACTCSMAVGSAEFVRLGNYARKPTLFFLVPGVLGVLCAAYIVTNLNMYYLKWIVLVVVMYSSWNLISGQIKRRKAYAVL